MAAEGLLKSDNRGVLLDAVVFASNLGLMSALAEPFAGLIRSAGNGSLGSGLALFALGLLLLVLPPVGAVLKRWHFHRGRSASEEELDALGGCLFNPIFYFCLVAVIFAGLNAAALQYIYGRREPPAGVFVGSILGGIVLIVIHTLLVYRYFEPPKSEPRSAFMRSSASEFVGDACIFLNALIFQLIWNSLSFAGIGHPEGAVEIVGRLLLLSFLALLLYFPPRMFYLAQDAGRTRTWAMIALANSPLIARLVFGFGAKQIW